MNDLEPHIKIAVDPTNPGQFFACCGLLELADRLCGNAKGYFDGHKFCIAGGGTLNDLLTAAKSVRFRETEDADQEEKDEDADNDNDDTVQPLEIISPIQFRLDWWQDKSIKTWAGSMKVHLIAAAMCHAIDPENSDPFNQGQVVYDPPKLAAAAVARKRKPKTKKREPFCFDSRRGMNSHSIDVGFSSNDLKLTTTAFPVVEFLSLVGLQRCRPTPTNQPRVFTYCTWSCPCCPTLLPPTINGFIGDPLAKCYRFENGFRSGQKKHKAYRSAIPIPKEAD
ncbi:MAG: type I-U CRISPR-associated protein Cas8c [Planctomycetota bacterium]|nr:type I-U CRISPR-associated protein Cas8c [Planctomycetota bacterium]